MTDFTANIQKPTYLGVAPTYNQCTASDTFTAVPGAKYLLHYKNGATAQGSTSAPNRVVNVANAAAPPPGSSPAANWADMVTSGGTGLGSNSESVSLIDNSTPFRNSSGVITLAHPGTVTTLTVAIFGPL